MTDPFLDTEIERILHDLELAVDRLGPTGRDAAVAHAEAKRVEAHALLRARGEGHRSAEERKAYATIASSKEAETADILERIYRDTLTHIGSLRTRLDLIRTQIVTQRQVQV